MPLHQAFERQSQWNGGEIAEVAVAEIWTALELGEQRGAHLEALLARVEASVPHADDYEAPLVTWAQDTLSVVDTALRALLGDAEFVPGAVEYAFESLKTAICMERTGFVDLGSDEREEEFLKTLLTDRRFLAELGFQDADLRALERCDEVETYVLLRTRSQTARWTPDRFHFQDPTTED
jgi:uncharacterized protein YjaG (DUF416 family)